MSLKFIRRHAQICPFLVSVDDDDDDEDDDDLDANVDDDDDDEGRASWDVKVGSSVVASVSAEEVAKLDFAAVDVSTVAVVVTLVVNVVEAAWVELSSGSSIIASFSPLELTSFSFSSDIKKKKGKILEN